MHHDEERFEAEVQTLPMEQDPLFMIIKNMHEALLTIVSTFDNPSASGRRRQIEPALARIKENGRLLDELTAEYGTDE